jgi:hypothetical protein
MLTSHASWKVLFYSITTVNESGNRNVTGFTGAMDFEASLKVKMRMFDQPYGFLLAANKKRESPYSTTPTILAAPSSAPPTKWAASSELALPPPPSSWTTSQPSVQPK